MIISVSLEWMESGAGVHCVMILYGMEGTALPTVDVAHRIIHHISSRTCQLQLLMILRSGSVFGRIQILKTLLWNWWSCMYSDWFYRLHAYCVLLYIQNSFYSLLVHGHYTTSENYVFGEKYNCSWHKWNDYTMTTVFFFFYIILCRKSAQDTHIACANTKCTQKTSI